MNVGINKTRHCEERSNLFLLGRRLFQSCLLHNYVLNLSRMCVRDGSGILFFFPERSRRDKKKRYSGQPDPDCGVYGAFRGNAQLLFVAFLFSFFASCNTQPEQKKPIGPAKYKKSLVNANKDLVALEQQDIENYILRQKWEMVETGSGLQYMIYEQGNGKQVEEGLVVQCAYTTGLLTGKTCYSSDKLGPKEFLVGRGGVESGLEEAVLLFREGDKIKIILPSHLAFGLVGDDDCIPKKAVLVYDLEVRNVLEPITIN
jgi:FKBP-type peptidyl-prolyl cis-trans isomerase FkpA